LAETVTLVVSVSDSADRVALRQTDQVPSHSPSSSLALRRHSSLEREKDSVDEMG